MNSLLEAIMDALQIGRDEAAILLGIYELKDIPAPEEEEETLYTA